MIYSHKTKKTPVQWEFKVKLVTKNIYLETGL